MPFARNAILFAQEIGFMNFQFLPFFIGLLALTSCDPTDRPYSSLTKKLDSLVNFENHADQFHGTLVVGKRDSIIYQKSVGVANRNWMTSIEDSTRFDICSVNKSFIAALIMKACEEGRLHLDDRLAEILANYNYTGYFNPDITVHQMLCHISGLPDYYELADSLKDNWLLRYKRMHFTNAAYVDFISSLPAKEPAKEFYYSNFAYHLLAIIIEDIYDKPFSDILKEKICEPLKLNNTFSSTSNQEVHKRLAEGYNFLKDKNGWVRNNFIDLTLGRRIFSTSADLYRWALAMDDTTFLSSHSLSLIQANHIGSFTDRASYGYGWAVHGSNSTYEMGNLGIKEPYIIHGGATEGYRAMLININHGEFIIAFLSNVGDQMDEIQFAGKVAQILMEDYHEK